VKIYIANEMAISSIFLIILSNGGYINTKTKINMKWALKSLTFLFTTCGKTGHNLLKMY
jgi:hypothetical protein